MVKIIFVFVSAANNPKEVKTKKSRNENHSALMPGSHTDRNSDTCEMENLTSKVHSLLIEASQSHRQRHNILHQRFTLQNDKMKSQRQG